MGHFKQLMSKNYISCNIQSVAAKLLETDIVKEQYPNILILIKISLLAPLTVRGALVSTMHTKGRLKTDHIATQMRISLDTPDLSTGLDQSLRKHLSFGGLTFIQHLNCL